MRLRNTIPHMAGESVSVNGTTYQLDGKGIVEVANEADAQKLLADRASWRPYVERAPIASIAVPELVKVVTPTVVETKPEQPVEEPQADEIEWPDPKVTMTVSQLREIADAYQVKYDLKTTKKVLVDLIMEAMYGEEE